MVVDDGKDFCEGHGLIKEEVLVVDSCMSDFVLLQYMEWQKNRKNKSNNKQTENYKIYRKPEHVFTKGDVVNSQGWKGFKDYMTQIVPHPDFTYDENPHEDYFKKLLNTITK